LIVGVAQIKSPNPLHSDKFKQIGFNVKIFAKIVVFSIYFVYLLFKFYSMNIEIKIGIGEALDRISILEIKMEKIDDEVKLNNIKKEYEFLKGAILPIPELYGTTELYQRLFTVNMLLWDVEDKLRELEKNINFGIDFIESARDVYKLNDKRAEIKRELNKLYQSDIIEEKSYK
jgi:hypothetical protein